MRTLLQEVERSRRKPVFAVGVKSDLPVIVGNAASCGEDKRINHLEKSGVIRVLEGMGKPSVWETNDTLHRPITCSVRVDPFSLLHLFFETQ